MTGKADPREARQASGRASSRHAILEAAVSVFEREGYQAASIDDIAEAAGVSRRTVYHHFQAKNDILVAATLEQAHLFLEELKRTVPPSDDFPAFVVESLCFVIRKAPSSRFFMLQMARGVGMESATIYFKDKALMGEWMDHFREPYIEALRKGQINPAIELRELLTWFGRIATSFLQYPSGGEDETKAMLDVFVAGALRHRAPGAAT